MQIRGVFSRELSRGTSPDESRQLRLANEHGLAAPVVRQTLFEVTAERVTAHVNCVFGFGQAKQVETCFTALSVSKAGCFHRLHFRRRQNYLRSGLIRLFFCFLGKSRDSMLCGFCRGRFQPFAQWHLFRPIHSPTLTKNLSSFARIPIVC